jgi:glyoxylase-like metal-dependent hydrolase (beta-lactamase superfamily II)/rhodanese-related sulfurtransferase
VLFEQFVDEDLGCASYLVGDESAGVAAVVDPPLDLDRIRATAARRGVRIARALETHTHADHVSGHGRLAVEDDVPVSIHALADAEYEHDALTDGSEVELGEVVVRTMHTPGHRPEHCCFAVSDRSRADEPWLVLTGDSLFVGDAARPDLAVEGREGAAELFASLRRLVELGDGVEVYPGHVAGSLCGAGMSSKGSTTIGFERRFNPMLRHDLVDEFVTASTGGAGLRPPNVERIVALNRGPFLHVPPAPGEVDGAAGATVLDVRPADAYAAGHLAGAVNVPVSGNAFGTKAGFALSPDDSIVLHATDEAEAQLAARRLNAVGFLEIRGWVRGAGASERTPPVDVEELARVVADDPSRVIDVREADERAQDYIPGTRHVPFHLVRAYAAHLAGNGPLVTMCESGPRAAVAASVLAAHGVDARPVLRGGMQKWKERGGETVSFRRCGGG